MDNFGDSGVFFAQSPTAPAQPPAAVEESAPNEFDLLKQEIQELKAQSEHLRSAKDQKINELSEQITLLNTTLQDQLSSKPTVEEEIRQQETQTDAVNAFWDTYMQQETQPDRDWESSIQ